MSYLLSVLITIYIRFTTKKRKGPVLKGWQIPKNFKIELRESEQNFHDNREVILGISSYFHDSSCAIIVDGKTLFAAQEERFTRIKNTSAFPHESISKGLSTLGLEIKDVTRISYFEDPDLKLDRIKHQIAAQSFFSSYTLVCGFFSRLWKYHLFFKRTFKADLLQAGFDIEFLKANPVIYSNHHLSHALSAYVPSHYTKATVIVIDAVGEYTTTSIWKANGKELQLLRYLNFPNSIGMLYSSITYYCGFKVNSGEYKLMGLAPYGNPVYTDLILNNLINIAEDSSYEINDEYLPFFGGRIILNEVKMETLFGFRRRKPETEISQEYMDLASSMQNVLNIYIEKLCDFSKSLNSVDNLCLAGGVALNCVTNGQLDRAGSYRNIWIQPAAGDAGTSLGAAYLASSNDLSHKSDLDVDHEIDAMQGAFLGTEYSDTQIEEILREFHFVYEKLPESGVFDKAALSIMQNRVIGWFQGRMEFGPRSLGARSILANPMDRNGQARINLKIKFRESFRPFAPAMLKSNAIKFFDQVRADKYMLFVSFLKSEYRFGADPTGNLRDVNLIRSDYPSITHVDYSARVQVVDLESPLHQLLIILEKHGMSMIVNTSFNVRGEPIVESPKDALFCFMATDLDDLFLGNFHLSKEKQHLNKSDFTVNFEND